MPKAPPKSKAHPPAPATVAELAAAPYNPRVITDEAARALEASMVAFGDISGIVFNFATGNLVAGHQRRRVLQGMGAEAIEWSREEVVGVDGPERRGTIRTVDGGVFGVRGVRWSLEKEMAANVAANSPTLTGAFDNGLDTLLGQILEHDEGLFANLRFDALLDAGNGEGGSLPDLRGGDRPNVRGISFMVSTEQETFVRETLAMVDAPNGEGNKNTAALLAILADWRSGQ